MKLRLRMKPVRLLVLLGVLSCTQPAYGWFFFFGGPTTDIVDMTMTVITAAQNILKSTEAVRKTVAMLEQVATLYRSYQNAKDLYNSVGNISNAAQKFQQRFRTAISSWTQPLDWRNMSQTLSRWGIQPADVGPLGGVNDFLVFYGHELNKFSSDMANAPRLLGRDRFIRDIVHGVHHDQYREPLRMSARHEVHALDDAADFQHGRLMAQLDLQMVARQRDRDALREMETAQLQPVGQDDEQSSLALLRATNVLVLERNRTLLGMADQEAAVAMADAIQRKAMANFWAYKRQQPILKAAVAPTTDW